MRNTTTLVTGAFNPVMLLAVYKGDHSGYYLESHEIDSSGTVLSGKPLSHATTDALLESFTKSKAKSVKPGGFVPANMLYIDVTKEIYIWRVPASKRYLHFANGLGIPEGEASLPALVFRASGHSLAVYAQKPGNENELFRAPFHNVSDSGGVCLGSAKATMKGQTYESVMDYWETIFFASVFTHITGAAPIDGNINSMYKKLIATGEDFDNELLIESKRYKKIKDLLK